MEEAYAAASLAVLRLGSEAGDEIQYLESECALRSILRRRPVVLGFVVSTLARKLTGELPADVPHDTPRSKEG